MTKRVTDYRVEWRREPAEGPVVALTVTDLTTGNVVTIDEGVGDLIAEARAIDGADPFDGGKLPSDRAVLEATFGVVVSDEFEAAPPPAAPLLERLAEAHDGLSDLSGLVVTPECVAAVSDAYDALEEMLAALTAAYAAIDAINPHDDAVSALNRAGLANGLVQAQRSIRAAIAKAEGRA